LSALESAVADGLEQVSVETLRKILLDMEAKIDSPQVQVSPLEVERYRALLEGSNAHEERVHAWNLEGFRQVISLGQSALKSLMLINGGAAVALLAFLGNLLAQKLAIPLLPFADSMRSFVSGVALSAAAYGLTYFSQLCYDNSGKSWQVTGRVLHVLTSLVAAAALAAFLWGSSLAYQGFAKLPPNNSSKPTPLRGAA
jgi:hypothetical protein